MSKIELINERYMMMPGEVGGWDDCLNEADEIEEVFRKLIWFHIDQQNSKRVTNWLDQRLIVYSAAQRLGLVAGDGA